MDRSLLVRATMMRMLSLGLLVALTGCSSWKLGSAPDGAVASTTPFRQGAARVCVVRTSILAMAVTMPTHDNGMLVGATRGGTYFCYWVEPGEHDITVEADEVATIRLHAEASQNYLLKQEIANTFGWVTCTPKWLPPSEADDALDGVDHEVLVGVPSDKQLPPLAAYAPAKHGTSAAAY